jgi:hypothetical protein
LFAFFTTTGVPEFLRAASAGAARANARVMAPATIGNFRMVVFMTDGIKPAPRGRVKPKFQKTGDNFNPT